MTQAQLAEKARNAIDAHNQALYDEVQAAQEAKDILDLQSQLYDVTGNKAAAAALLEQQHAAALAGMSPALAGATRALWDAQAAATATQDALGAVSKAYSNVQTIIDAQKDVLNAAYQTATDGLQSSIDALTESVGNLQTLSQSLHSTLDSMSVPGQEKSDRQAAQAQIEAALAIAKAGGPLPDADSLKNALSTVSKDASGQFGSYLDYQRDLYRTKNNVAGLAGYTDAQLSTEQLTLKSIQDQKKALDAAHKEDLARLDATLDQAKQQTNLLNGIVTGISGLPAALAALMQSISNAGQNPTTSKDVVSTLFHDLLGRDPKQEGLAFWSNALQQGTSIDRIKAEIINSAEYQAAHPGTTVALPAFAAGGYHAGGARLVGENGPEIEVTGASRIFNAGQTRSMLGSANDELVAEIRALRAEVRELRASAASTAENTGDVAKVIKRVGGRGDFIAVKEFA